MNIPALTSALIVTGLGLIVIIDGLVPSTPRPGAALSPAQRWARLTHRPAGAAGRRRLLLRPPASAAQLLARAAYMSGATVRGLAGTDPLAGVLPRHDAPLEDRVDPPGA